MIIYIYICIQLLQRNAVQIQNHIPEKGINCLGLHQNWNLDLGLFSHALRCLKAETQTLTLPHIHCCPGGRSVPCPLHTSAHPSRLPGPPRIVSSQLWHLSPLVIRWHRRPSVTQLLSHLSQALLSLRRTRPPCGQTAATGFKLRDKWTADGSWRKMVCVLTLWLFVVATDTGFW